MYLKVINVEPLEDYQLVITFENSEKRMFDMKPYLDKGVFKELKDKRLFNTVRVSFDSIEWENEADFDPEALYELGVPVKKYA
ncbi:MAG: DUF2442 domain-containing protein [Cyclobacteriaceae bacterium]